MLSPEQQQEIEVQLQQVDWTRDSLILGMTLTEGMPRVNEQLQSLRRVLNETMTQLLGGRHFRWTSIQVGKDTITKPRIVASHLGPSVHLMIGDFKGGTFRTVDNTVRLTEPNQLVAFDPHKPHLSELHSGTKYSITYYYDKSVKELSTSDKTRLRSLGFRLDAFTAEVQTPLRPSVDPLTAAPGDEHMLIPPDTKEGTEEVLEPFVPPLLTAGPLSFPTLAWFFIALPSPHTQVELYF